MSPELNVKNFDLRRRFRVINAVVGMSRMKIPKSFRPFSRTPQLVRLTRCRSLFYGTSCLLTFEDGNTVRKAKNSWSTPPPPPPPPHTHTHPPPIFSLACRTFSLYGTRTVLSGQIVEMFPGLSRSWKRWSTPHANENDN